MNRFLVLITVKAILAYANGHVAFPKGENQLHPVHGLYVKPSDDGTTGDLYVAATEDNGAKTQWLTDQPIHFLPMHSQPAIPASYSNEELNQHKRAVVNSPVQYTYALPSASNSEASAVPAITYPYALPSAISTAPTPAPASESKAEAPAPTPAAAAVVPQYNPYQYFYPQMYAAYANMVNILKDAGLNDDTASSVVSQATPMWPHSYAYPYQYVMVDPTAWAQAQSLSTTTTAAPSTTANPTTENE